MWRRDLLVSYRPLALRLAIVFYGLDASYLGMLALSC